MKFRRVLAFVLLLAVLFALGACRQPNNADDAGTDIELPELKIGADILKPFFYVDENGDYAGVDAELAEEACRRAGYRPCFVTVSWSDRDTYLQDRSIDCIWSAFIKNGREDAYLWTDTYLQSDLRMIEDVNGPKQDISSVGGHGGIAVRAGSKLEELMLGHSDSLEPVQIYSCGTFEMAETAFVKGYASALGGHELVLADMIDHYPGQYRFMDGSILTADLGVAFRKDDTSGPYGEINAALREMKADGTISSIYEKYVSELSASEEGSDHARR